MSNENIKSIEDLKGFTIEQINKALTSTEIADLMMSTNVFKDVSELPKKKAERVDMIYAVIQNKYEEEEEISKPKKPYPYKTTTFPKTLINPIVEIFDQSEPYDLIREKYESLESLFSNFKAKYDLEDFRNDFNEYKESGDFSVNNEILKTYLMPYFQVLKDLEESTEDGDDSNGFGEIMRSLQLATLIKYHPNFTDLSDLRNAIREEEYSVNTFDRLRPKVKQWLDLLK